MRETVDAISAAHGPTPRRWWGRNWPQRALTAWLLFGGAALTWSAFATILTFAWPQPAFDQFRLYPLYLELAFPQNVLQLENQHRPVFPGLVRVAEIHWFHADQRLQIGFGLLCACLTALGLAHASLAARALSWPVRAAGVSASLVAVFWLGNARMLLHGNELVHAYLVTLSVVGAAWAGARAGHAHPRGWMLVASLAAVVATFSFGPGIALFPAIVALAWIQRLRWTAWLIPVLVCAVSLALYLLVLPGDGGVRGALEFRPWESFQTAARWIASPWIHAWLGYADPPLSAGFADAVARGPGRWLIVAANGVQESTGLTWSGGLAFGIGLTGLAAMAAWLAHAAIHRPSMDALQASALVLMMFGAASAGIIGIGRLEYFVQHPDQIFADRYLVWPCLFWLGVALKLLSSASTRSLLQWIPIGAIALLPLALAPTHQAGAGWGSVVYRSNQALAAAARADVLDREILWPGDPSAGLEAKLESLRLFRERGLAMFAPRNSRRLGESWTGSVREGALLSVAFDAPAHVVDVRDDRAAVRVAATVTGDVRRLGADPALVVLDDRGVVVGYGAVTHPGEARSPLRWSVPLKRGLDLYIGRYDASMQYRVLLLDEGGSGAIELGKIPQWPASAPPM